MQTTPVLPLSPSGRGSGCGARRTACVSGNRGDPLSHGLDQRLQVLERTARQHAVTEIEDVTRASGRLSEHLARPLDHELAWAEQQRRVEIALHPQLAADALPARAEVDAPVE